MTRLILLLGAAWLLAACGSGGSPPPDWKTDAADLIERYKQHALRGENTLAERYFQQAIAATGGAGRLDETARLWLVHCATRRAMLIQDNCDTYLALSQAGARTDDHTYYRFITLQWEGLDATRLPAAYARLPGSAADQRNTQLAAIADPLSRLLAASLLVLVNPADTHAMSIGVETASERGWRQPLLTLLKLQLSQTSDPEVQKRLLTRLQLVEQHFSVH
ncbi:MAG: hypothetical protein ABL877_02120 [Thiobacillus sp.]